MQIKRCPYCKHPKPWIVRIHPLRGFFTKYYIECRSCHCCGKTKIGKRRAIKAWNVLGWLKESFEIVEAPKTNADRIRAMSDKELAELLEEMTYDSMEHRAEYWLKWLKQPAEVDNGQA